MFLRQRRAGGGAGSLHEREGLRVIHPLPCGDLKSGEWVAATCHTLPLCPCAALSLSDRRSLRREPALRLVGWPEPRKQRRRRLPSLHARRAGGVGAPAPRAGASRSRAEPGRDRLARTASSLSWPARPGGQHLPRRRGAVQRAVCPAPPVQRARSLGEARSILVVVVWARQHSAVSRLVAVAWCQRGTRFGLV